MSEKDKRIAGLELVLKLRTAERDQDHEDLDMVAAQLEEAQGKLEAVSEWAAQRSHPCSEDDGCPDCLFWYSLDRILRGTKEGE